MVAYDDGKREVKLSLRQADILEALASDAEIIKEGGVVPEVVMGHGKLVRCFADWCCSKADVK